MQMEINEVRHVNSVNSDITNKLLEPLDRKSKSDFYNFFDNIIFIQNLTNPDRQRAKHKPKDNKGKVIVDITNPHILEDMSYFVERAEHFRKHGVYTFLFPNKSPGSEYKKFWDEERRRCKEGLVRPSDGEWITGYNYFYWNYSPILKVEEADDEIMQETLDDLEVGIQADRFEDFPDIWDGDYLFFHYVDQAESVGQHTSVIKTRGSGHSFKFSSMKNRNYFMYESSKSFSFASEKEFLTRDGVLSKAWVNMNFIDNNTPFSQPREFKDVDMHKRSSYKDPKHKTENGFMSEIIGVTCKNEPSKGRGKRGKLLAFDETGIFPGLKKTWITARKSVEQGRFVYGHLSAGGTGGEEGSDFEALEAFTYHPRSYGIRPLKNVYDLSKADSESSMFVPAYLNRQGCYDENGNSDIVKALVEVLIQRQKIRQSSNDPNDLVKEKAEAPITIQEAVLRVEGSLFPVQDLKDYLAEISPSIDRFTKGHFVGRFRISGSEVSFQMSEDMEPITEFPIKDNKSKEGAVEIFNHPIEFGGHIDSYRYIMGLDSFDDDHSTTTSLGSAIVFDRYTDRIVAEYTGRPNTANEFYELCYRLARYYNAKINYENDKKGLYAYFYNKNALNYLVDNPEILAEKDLAKITNNYGNKKKGTQSSTAVNAWARRLIADWLIEDAYGTGGTDEEGNEVPPLMNLQTLRSIGLIKELIAWHPDINADRVSAFGMVMILRADMMKLETSQDSKNRKNFFNEDPFFKRTGPNMKNESYNAVNFLS